MKMSGCLTREMNRWVRSREPQSERERRGFDESGLTKNVWSREHANGKI